MLKYHPDKLAQKEGQEAKEEAAEVGVLFECLEETDRLDMETDFVLLQADKTDSPAKDSKDSEELSDIPKPVR